MQEPSIIRENVETLLDKKFIRVYDLHYAPGRSYYNASRRSLEDLAAVKNDEEFRNMIPDAASCVVVVRQKNEPDRLLLAYEYRYPAGRYLLGIPAGLVDPADREKPNPALETARREIFEETGLTVKESDRLFLINPLVFSTPGMTDESNALVCAVVDVEDLNWMSREGNEGAECIRDFKLITAEEAEKLLRDGRDENGNYYSLYTWAALMMFATKRYEDKE